MHKKIIARLSVFLIVAVALTACQKEVKQDTGSGDQKITVSSEQPSEKVLIKHSKGETEVPAHPKKVIVFDTAILDSLDFLGVDIAGVPRTGTPFPANIAKFKDEKYINAGTLQEPDFETISAVQPDLIIGSGRADKAYSELSSIAPTIVLSIDYKNYLDSLKDRTLTAAQLFGKKQEALQYFAILDQEIATTKAKASKAGTALFVMVNGGKISAYGPGSRFGFIFDVLGMEPVASFADNQNHGNVISLEYILEKNPDWIFVLDRETAIGESQQNVAAKKVLENELINKTKAKQKNQIIYVDAPALYIAGGLRTYQNYVHMVDEVVSR